MTPELLPCPFCGQDPLYDPEAEGHAPGYKWPEQVYCRACGITFRKGERGVQDPVARWNQGPIPAEGDKISLMKLADGTLVGSLSTKRFTYCGGEIVEERLDGSRDWRKGRVWHAADVRILLLEDLDYSVTVGLVKIGAGYRNWFELLYRARK